MEPGLGKKLERERLVAVPSLGYPLLGPVPTGGAVASNEVCVSVAEARGPIPRYRDWLSGSGTSTFLRGRSLS